MSDIAATIRSRGYWQVQLRPTVFEEKRIKTLADLQRAFEAAHVELRGWDYPHRPRDGAVRHSDYIEGTVSWERHHEVWRLYQSVQFVHLFSMPEDWMDDPSGRWSRLITPGELLDVTATLWTLTEIFLFAARLVEALKIAPDVVLSYRLFGIGGRQLQTLDPRRMPLHEWRKAAPDLKEYGKELSLSTSQLIGSAADLAVDETIELYERFNWDPARQSVVDDQRKLLERRID